MTKDRKFTNERETERKESLNEMVKTNINVICAFTMTYHCHSFTTEHLERTQCCVEGHVCENVDDRDETARDGDSFRQIPK